MATLDDLLGVAYRTGHLIGQGVAVKAITGDPSALHEAVATTLANSNEIQRQDPVVAQFMREKALAALHADDDMTIDADCVEEPAGSLREIEAHTEDCIACLGEGPASGTCPRCGRGVGGGWA